MFRICAEDSVGNTGMFFSIAEQCLCSAKAFSSSGPALPGGEPGVGKWLGGDTTGKANGPKGYPRPCGIVLSNKRGRGRGEVDRGWWEERRRKGGMFEVMAFVFPSNA